MVPETKKNEEINRIKWNHPQQNTPSSSSSSSSDPFGYYMNIFFEQKDREKNGKFNYYH